MKEFIEKLIGRLEEIRQECHKLQKTTDDAYGYMKQKQGIDVAKEIVKELAEEYKDNVIIDGQYCWQTCGATEHCKECNRLCNGNIDYYENYDFMAEENNGGWIPCSKRLPVYLDNVLVCAKNGGRTIAHLKHTPIEWRDMYMNKIDDVIAWKHLDAPYQPKGE